ncbi:MAG: NAD(P)H-binding protein [Candidatus Omnitrophota bacterium]
MDSKKVLVLGASGYVGSRLIPALLAEGYRVRASGRSLGTLRTRPWAQHPAVDLFPVDIFNREKLKEAGQGCFAAYYLVHSMNPQHKNFAQADREAAYNMIWAARESHLERIIYLGGLGEERDHLSKHLLSRLEVNKILHSGEVPVTTLRAAQIIGTGSFSFEIVRYLVNRLPVMITPRWVSTRSQPIAIRNVLRYLTGCLKLKEAEGQVYDIGGADIVSYRELMEIYAEEAGLRKRIIISVPFLTPRLSSYWISFVTPLSASLARPLAEGLVNEVICRDKRIQDLITQNLLNCREAIRLTLNPEKAMSYPGLNKSFPPPEGKYPGDPPWVGGDKWMLLRIR